MVRHLFYWFLCPLYCFTFSTILVQYGYIVESFHLSPHHYNHLEHFGSSSRSSTIRTVSIVKRAATTSVPVVNGATDSSVVIDGKSDNTRSSSSSSSTGAVKVRTKRNGNLHSKPSIPVAPVFTEICSTTGVTLTRFMNEKVRLNPELRELTTLLGAIDTACKAISNLVKRAPLPSSMTLGYAGEINIQGEEQKKLDVITNEILKQALRFTGRLGVLASEEEDTPVDLSIGATPPLFIQNTDILIEEGDKYVAVFDPLDGSSNVDAGIPTGTIIGIYQHDDMCEIDPTCYDDMNEECTEQEATCLANTLQPGTNLVAAAYCLYSSSTLLTLTLGNGVYMFTLDENIGEFVLSKPNIQIPVDTTIYSFNEANIDMWDEPVQRTVRAWRNGTGQTKQRFTSRYVGSMVGDVHRTLMYGGVFGYPNDHKHPNGKLRLLYECAPMSFIIEQAGGIATTGFERIMNISPRYVHQRVPIFLGSKNTVQELLDAYNNDRCNTNRLENQQ